MIMTALNSHVVKTTVELLLETTNISVSTKIRLSIILTTELQFMKRSPHNDFSSTETTSVSQNFTTH